LVQQPPRGHAELLGNDRVKPSDDLYRDLLAASALSTLRTRYFATIKEIRKTLGALQADHVIALANGPATKPHPTPDTAPNFASLISDPKMRAILTKRWQECGICVGASAPLAPRL